MKIYKDLAQGTPEWLEARRGILTASVIGKLITPKTIKVSTAEATKTVINKLAAERITGVVESIPTTRDMERGNNDEPIAREYYSQYAGVPVDEVGFITENYSQAISIDLENLSEGAEVDFTLGYSPDGLVGEDGLIEIKSRKPEHQLATVLAGTIPDYHMAQVQLGLLITGRKWCDYVSFRGGMRLFVTRILPDNNWQKTLVLAGAYAETRIQEIVRKYERATAFMPTTERPFWYDDQEWED